MLVLLLNLYPANVENMVRTNNASRWQMGFNSAFEGLNMPASLMLHNSGVIA
jgi:hypothetical protein